MEGEGRSLVCRVARRGVDGSRAVGRLWCSGQGQASLVGRGAEADKREEVHGWTNECEGMRVHMHMRMPCQCWLADCVGAVVISVLGA